MQLEWKAEIVSSSSAMIALRGARTTAGDPSNKSKKLSKDRTTP